MVELVVVAAIVSVLIIVAGFQFVGWLARYNVENQLKTLQADLMSARQRAMERNIQYVAALSVNSYLICEDTNGNGVCDAPAETTAPNISPLLSKNGLRYSVNWVLDFGVVPNNTVLMDRRGMLVCPDPLASCTGTIWLTKPGTADRYNEREIDYDCIMLGRTRVKAGKLNDMSGACDEK